MNRALKGKLITAFNATLRQARYVSVGLMIASGSYGVYDTLQQDDDFRNTFEALSETPPELNEHRRQALIETVRNEMGDVERFKLRDEVLRSPYLSEADLYKITWHYKNPQLHSIPFAYRDDCLKYDDDPKGSLNPYMLTCMEDRKKSTDRVRANKLQENILGWSGVFVVLALLPAGLAVAFGNKAQRMKDNFVAETHILEEKAAYVALEEKRQLQQFIVNDLTQGGIPQPLVVTGKMTLRKPPANLNS